MLEEKLVQKAKHDIEPVMAEWLPKLAEKYDSVANPRYIGAFGCLDLLNAKGEPIQHLDGSNCAKPDAIMELKQALLANGIYGLLRPPLLHCAPPLVIKPT